MRKSSARFLAFLVAISLSPLTGCATSQRDAELTKIARDWSMTIRASQVLPVYPLTEDLLPGDIFLTTTPIGKEREFFRERGFLPFDNLIARLAVHQSAEMKKRMKAMYKDTYHASRPDAGANFSAGGAWPTMPMAGFPTYTIDVRRSGGANSAIPVQGIPLGLSLLGADKATASVTLKDAFSYGLDMSSLNEVVDAWHADPEVQAFLARYADSSKADDQHACFVRIVSRVYLVKKVNVSVNSAKAFGGAGQFGGAAAPGQLDTDPTKGAQNAEILNNSVSKTVTTDLNPAAPTSAQPAKLPSVSVRFLSATSRGVSMDETFDRPLAIGYLAIDRRVLPGGRLGPSMHTLIRIQSEGANFVSAAHGVESVRDQASDLRAMVTSLVDSDDASDQKLLQRWQKQLRPPLDWPGSFETYSFDGETTLTATINPVTQDSLRSPESLAEFAYCLASSRDQIEVARRRTQGKSLQLAGVGPTRSVDAEELGRLFDAQGRFLDQIITSLTSTDVYRLLRQQRLP